jgi:hypothetical protein
MAGRKTDLRLGGAIGAQLERLRRRHRKHIYVPVTGKGNKTRSVPFQIGYVRDLLEIGVWLVRRDQIRHWTGHYPHSRPAREVFLSAKTGRAMTAGAVGDLAKYAFDAAGVRGSGQRLRAHFATQLCAQLWDEAFAKNGFRWDQTIENFVLETVATTLGHSTVDTTIRHYLDLALLEYFEAGGKSKLKDLRAAWSAIANNHKSLNAGDIGMLGQLASRLASGASEFKDVLAALVAHPKYLSGDHGGQRVGADDGDHATKHPLLRVVPSPSAG